MRKESANSLRIVICALILPLLLCAGSCGYRLVNPIGERISRDIQKVYVDVFANNTPEANIETEFRNAFVDQFIKGRRFKVVNNREIADAILKGEIGNLVTSPLAYRGTQNIAAEKKITVTMSLTLTTSNAATILWQDKSFTQWEDFDLGGGTFDTARGNQQNALSKLAKDAAERAYRMMTSDF